jgi:hypothetical protein
MCIRGLALAVYNPKGEILVLQEHESKPHLGKLPGMHSIPMETFEPDELDRSCMARLIEQELSGVDISAVLALRHPVGKYQVVRGVWVDLYFAKTENNRLPKPNGEVGNYRWLSSEKALLLWLRQGAWEMISDSMQNKSNVICMHCRTPEAQH